MRRFAAAFPVLALIGASMALVATPAGADPLADGPLVTINADGGLTADDGLKIDYASGNLQVHRRGVAQLYDHTLLPVSGSRDGISNWISLAVGDTIVGGGNFSSTPTQAPFDTVTYQAWDDISSGGGSTSGSGTITSVLTADVGGLSYEVDVTLAYTFPRDYVTMTYDLVIPDGNTAEVRLGWTGDSYLGGTDAGHQFVEPGAHGPFIGVLGLPPGGGVDPTKAGVRSADPATTLTYMTGSWWCPVDNAGIADPYPDCPSGVGQMARNIDLPDSADPADPVDNNGFAYRFPAATTPGTHTYTVDHVFTTQAPAPSLNLAFDPAPAVAGADVTATYDLVAVSATSDASTGLGFEHTLPAGVTALEVLTNDCGDNSATIGDGTEVVLVAGTVPAGDGTTPGRCTIAIRMQATPEGTFDFGPGVTTTGLNSEVAETLVVTTAPPVLTLAFDPSTVVAGTDVTATYDLTAVLATSDASTGLGFEHTLPAGVTALEVLTNDCGSTTATIVDGTKVVLAAGTVPAGDGTTPGHCAITVRMQVTPQGTYIFGPDLTTTGLTSEVEESLVITPPPGSFAGLAPVRLADTRPSDPVLAGTVRAFTVADVGGVPADASAVVLNVTATEATGPGYLAVFPCGDAQPFVSNVNYQANSDTPNAVTVGIGTNGQICVYTTTDAHVIIDAFGYYSPSADAMLNGVEPVRLGDTRPSDPVLAGTVRAFTVADVGGVPADASAVVLNVTATEATGPGYLAVFPCGDAQPFVSNVNYQANSDTPNAVTVGIGTNGQICVYSTTDAHVIIDAFAYYATSGGARVAALEPARLADTRPSDPVLAGTVRAFTVADVGGVPADASAVVLNVTATEATGPGYLAVFPCGDAQPFVSNVNYQANSDTPNAVTVGIGTNGQICVYTTTDAHVIIDAFAYAGPATPPAP